MLDRVANLLFETEAAFFDAQSRHRRERSADSRLALREATQALDRAKDEAERVLWQVD
jgi:hypothetical protein